MISVMPTLGRWGILPVPPNYCYSHAKAQSHKGSEDRRVGGNLSKRPGNLPAAVGIETQIKPPQLYRKTAQGRHEFPCES